MDLFSTPLLPGLLLCTFLTLIFLFSSFFTLYKHKSSKPNLPPGKSGWPIVGETLQLLLSGWKGHPEKFSSERKNRYASDIFRTSLFWDNMVFFCGPVGNKFLFSNENKLVTAWWPKVIDKLFYDNPPSLTSTALMEEGNSYRALLLGFLKLDAIHNYIPTMDSIARGHIDKEWRPKGEDEVVVVYELMRKYTLELACQLLLGIHDHEHMARFGRRFVGVVAGLMSVPIDFPGTAFNKAIKDARFLREDLMAIIKERKTRLEKKEDTIGRDIISYLLLTPKENGKFMSDEAIARNAMGLLIAGYDTASVALTFTIKHLAELPFVYHGVFKEIMEIAKNKGPEELLNWGDIQKMRYTWNVVCEAMRIAPPGPMGFKEALTDFTFAGYTIPKGWKVCWSAHSTHKDPVYFPNPEKFDPTRFEGNGPAPYTYIPFGGGPRICPGKEYARLEILVFIYNLVKMFKWEKLIPNEKTVFKPAPSPENGLPILIKPHETVS